jgi:hypothetical protein
VDLPGPEAGEGERFAAAAAAAGESEDDWQFNTDTPGPGEELAGFDDTTPPPAEITDSEPTESDSVESFFELDGLRDPGPERGQEAPRKSPPQAAAAAEPAREAPKPAAKPARAKSPIEPEQEVGFEDLGNPDSWDFGLDAKRESKAAPKRTAPARAPAKPAARARAQAEPVAPLPRATAAPMGRAGAALSAVAWLLAFAFFGFGLRGVLAPGVAVASLPAAPLGALEVASLRVRHVENFYAGSLLVVSGELHNPGGSPAKAAAMPRLRIRDAAGAAVEVASPWLGAELPERRLREDDPAALGDELGRSARALAERTLAPDERVPVQAVIAGLPPRAAAFAVEGAPLSAAQGSAAGAP